MAFTVIIPARLEASRLPNKVMLPIADKPMIEHVYAAAVQSSAESVVIATDHPTIEAWAKNIGAPVVMTRTDHISGTLRIAEAVEALALADDAIIVGVQADEPLIDPTIIKQLAESVPVDMDLMATVAEPLVNAKEWQDPNVVKVVCSEQDDALYFTRAPIGDAAVVANAESPILRHIGLYAYHVKFVKQFAAWPVCSLENAERLEQLRALYHGARMPILRVPHQPGFGVDTPEDYTRMCALISAQQG